MSGSSETELRALVRSLGIPGFLGVYDSRFPGFLHPQKRQCAIVNTGTRESGGMHWIAMAWEPVGYKLNLFDPLGWSRQELKKYYGFSYENLVRRSALQNPTRCVELVRNQQAVQCSCSGSCGLWCCFFLYCFKLRPVDPFGSKLFQSLEGARAAVHPPAPHLLHQNQEKLYSFLRQQSFYFRQHASSIEGNTRLGLIKTH